MAPVRKGLMEYHGSFMSFQDVPDNLKDFDMVFREFEGFQGDPEVVSKRLKDSQRVLGPFWTLEFWGMPSGIKKKEVES